MKFMCGIILKFTLHHDQVYIISSYGFYRSSYASSVHELVSVTARLLRVHQPCPPMKSVTGHGRN